jgi:hypothetical protein
VIPTELPSESAWGHYVPDASINAMVEQLRESTRTAITEYLALPNDPEPCEDASGFERASVTIPVSPELADQLMNSRCGYRAHYYVSVATGEALNRKLVELIAPLFVAEPDLFQDKYRPGFFERSLLGRYSKLWFPKKLTDPAASTVLARGGEKITIGRWKEYWRARPKPWKGLFAPRTDSLLLNGTFVDLHSDYEQKPGRSAELYASGWV